MIIKGIGMVIGVMLLVAGLYYLSKEKDDPESRKIYLIVSVIGLVIFAASLILLIL